MKLKGKMQIADECSNLTYIEVGGKNTAAVEDIFFPQAIKIEEMTVCLSGGFLDVA